MSLSVVYDLSRLITRVLNSAPNGIDRVDVMLARHFLNHSDFATIALRFGFLGPKILTRGTAIESLAQVTEAWRENQDHSEQSIAYDAVVARLRQDRPNESGTAGRIVSSRRRSARVAQTVLRQLSARGRKAIDAVPVGSVYINATHFPIEWRQHVAWLEERKDVHPVFWVHDLFPVERPDWFWRREPVLHQKRLALLARRGAAAVVASDIVESSLRDALSRLGRQDLPIFRARLPVSAIFETPPQWDQKLLGIPFFVVCATIEPRKNHLLLLRIWRDLIGKLGRDAPRLIIIGKRGWNNEDIVKAMEDHEMRDHVIEVCGLPTIDYKRLLDHCVALLAPSFAEGFGLPLAEAIAAGVPAIVSDIPAFRAQNGKNVTYLDPLSEAAWRAAIVDQAFKARDCVSFKGSAWSEPSQEARYLQQFDAFLSKLA